MRRITPSNLYLDLRAAAFKVGACRSHVRPQGETRAPRAHEYVAQTPAPRVRPLLARRPGETARGRPPSPPVLAALLSRSRAATAAAASQRQSVTWRPATVFKRGTVKGPTQRPPPAPFQRRLVATLTYSPSPTRTGWSACTSASQSRPLRGETLAAAVVSPRWPAGPQTTFRVRYGTGIIGRSTEACKRALLIQGGHSEKFLLLI